MTDSGRSRRPGDEDPRAEELAGLAAQEEEFLRAAETLGPEHDARLDRLDRTLRRAVLGGAQRSRPRRPIRSITVRVLATAAALTAIVLFSRGRTPEERPVLRGDSRDEWPRVESVVTEEGGTPVVRFQWVLREGADSYEIVVLDADRRTVARLEAGGATSARWEIPAELVDRPLGCVVVAFREGREVGRSGMEALGGGNR